MRRFCNNYTAIGWIGPIAGECSFAVQRAINNAAINISTGVEGDSPIFVNHRRPTPTNADQRRPTLRVGARSVPGRCPRKLGQSPTGRWDIAFPGGQKLLLCLDPRLELSPLVLLRLRIGGGIDGDRLAQERDELPGRRLAGGRLRTGQQRQPDRRFGGQELGNLLGRVSPVRRRERFR